MINVYWAPQVCRALCWVHYTHEVIETSRQSNRAGAILPKSTAFHRWEGTPVRHSDLGWDADFAAGTWSYFIQLFPTGPLLYPFSDKNTEAQKSKGLDQAHPAHR